jgi:hypothetical protein
MDKTYREEIIPMIKDDLDKLTDKELTKVYKFVRRVIAGLK